MEWFIPYNVASSKNSKEIVWNAKLGRRMLVSSKLARAYEKTTEWYYKLYGAEFKRAIKKLELEYPLRVKFTFVRDTRRQFDYINAAQIVQDLMVKHEWFPDDSMKYLIPVFGEYSVDKANPGVKIEICLTKNLPTKTSKSDGL